MSREETAQMLAERIDFVLWWMELHPDEADHDEGTE